MDQGNKNSVDNSAVAGNIIPKKKKKKKTKKIVTWVVIIAVVVVGFMYFNSQSANTAGNMGAVHTTAVASRNDISVTLTGTGTLEPADKYSVTSLITGEILDSPFEEGDIVEKDTVLYMVDSSDIANNLEKSELALSRTQTSHNRLLESLDDLSIKADNGGTVTDIFVEIGDEVQPGQTIAKVMNNSVMSVELPFNSDDADNFYIGQEASVTIEGTYETIMGTVTGIKNVEEVVNGYQLIKKVEIDVTNPGGLSAIDVATASISGVACTAKSNLTNKDEDVLTSMIAGEITSIPVAEGDWVNADQTIVVMQSDTLSDNIENSESTLRDVELSLESQQDLLDEYSIKSPIKGTIIDKEYKTGDNLEQGKVLCTIFDLSYLTMTLNVDELDISKISVGQKVKIDAEATENQSFVGKVTKISINGTTVNGVTVYPVTIQIDESEGLLPGMNVDATIEVTNKEGVVSIPIEAVERGNLVLVKTATPLQGEPLKVSQVPGYEYVNVELGISNEDLVEIVSGINEGDEIAIIGQYTSLEDQMMMYGPRPGGGF